MFDSKMIAIGGLSAGLLLGAWGVFLHDDRAVVPDAPNAIESLVTPQPAHGLRSTDEIVDFWTKRVEATPGGYLDRTQLGLALSGQAREHADLELFEDAEVVLRDALDINPTDDTAQLALGQALHSQHRFAEALVLADQVRAADVSSLGALALLGDSNFELGEYDTARVLYEELAMTERSAPAVSRLSRLAYATGDRAGALALAEEALELSERLALRPVDRAFYVFQLGHVRFVTGDTAGAITLLEHALELSPASPAAREELAFVFASSGRHGEAEALYEELLATGPAADLHGTYADLLRERGAFELAAEQERLGLELALSTVDRFPAERRHLAEFFMTRDPAMAVALAEQDLAERSDVGAYDTLAWALFHDGQTARAADVIGLALATGIEDPSIRYHAGAIAAAAGDTTAARTHLDAALSISSTFHPTEAGDAAALRGSLG